MDVHCKLEHLIPCQMGRVTYACTYDHVLTDYHQKGEIQIVALHYFVRLQLGSSTTSGKLNIVYW